MKYLIGQSKLDSLIYDFLDSRYVPDYGWASNEYYMNEAKKYGYTHFEINDVYGYFYLYAANERDNNLPRTLFIHDWVAGTLSDYFGDFWQPVFVKWFNKNTNLSVEHILIGRE